MSDLIRRSDAENIFRRARRAMKPENYSGQEFFIRDNILLNAEQIIHSLPAVDAVKVVRCADCKYLNEELAIGEWDGSCRYWNTHSVTYSWFCSQGQRREDGDT